MDKIFLTFLHSAGFSHNDLKKIFEHHNNYEDIYTQVLSGKRIPSPWMTEERYLNIREKLTKLDIKNIEKILQDKQIKIITIDDESYPEKLRTIRQAPYLLYVR